MAQCGTEYLFSTEFTNLKVNSRLEKNRLKTVLLRAPTVHNGLASCVYSAYSFTSADLTQVGGGSGVRAHQPGSMASAGEADLFVAELNGGFTGAMPGPPQNL
jgi:hypothetical protein